MSQVDETGKVVEEDEVLDLTQTEAAKALEAAVEGDEEKEPKVVPPKEDWAKKKLQERVAKLTAQSKAKDEELARLKAASPPQPEEALQAQIDAKANEKAQAIAIQMRYNEETSKVMEAGKASFKDFDAKVAELRSAVIDPSDLQSQSRFVGLVSGVMETADGDPQTSAKLIHALGSDPELAERLLAMSPVKMGRELSKMAEAPEVDPVSNAPKPISTIVGGRGTNHVPIDPSDPGRSSKLGSKEWFERRNAQVKQNRANGVRMA